MNDILNQIADRLYLGDAEAVARLTQDALSGGLNPSEVLAGGLIEGMDRVGADFRDGTLYVPDVLVAARAMHFGMDILRPLLTDSDGSSAGTIIIGTVKGDLHDIGKNLVVMMLEGAGFEVIDLGTDVSSERFIEVIRNEQPTFIGMSALLTTTMPAMRETIEAIEASGLRESVKVLVGGAPVTDDYASEIGADGFAPDASRAVELARSLV